MPWKNGGGATIEVCAAPDGSTLENFDWRVSRARIDRSSPFSRFPGVDRTLVAIDGAGILLRFDGAESVALSVGDPPLCFAGEAYVESAMVAGPVTELNVMTRRDRFCHRLTVLTDGRPSRVIAQGGVIMVIVATGRTIIHTVEGQSHLSANDAVLLYAGDGAASVAADPGSRLFLIEIGPSDTFSVERSDSRG